MAADWENPTLIDGSITKDSSEQMKQASKLEWLIDIQITSSDWLREYRSRRRGCRRYASMAQKDQVPSLRYLSLALVPDPFLELGDEPKSREDAERSQELSGANWSQVA